MAVTRTFAAGPEQFFQQIDNIIKSHSLRGSESLCKLLQYLAKQSLEHPDAPVKEYQIATEVYGRPAGFDPQSDSTIRVQAGRLRMKLAEYYAAEGAVDPIVVRIPKGSYHLTFEARQINACRSATESVPSRDDIPGAPSKPSLFGGESRLYCLRSVLSHRWPVVPAFVESAATEPAKSGAPNFRTKLPILLLRFGDPLPQEPKNRG